MRTLNLFEEFSSVENLKLAFIYLKHEAKNASLPIDPTWYSALSAINDLGEDFFSALSSYIRSGHYRPDKAGFIYADKDNADFRPISALTIIDRIIYQAILNPAILGNKLDKKLHNYCFGNRIDGQGKYLCDYPNKWRQFCDSQIDAFRKGYVWRLECDIRTFYEQIPIKKLIEVLEENFKIDKKLLDFLQQQLITWAENEEICLGIPQGPFASHVLANAYLHIIDIYLNDYVNDGSIKYYRYADDMVLMAKDGYLINSTVSKLSLILRKFNLHLNEKTKVEKLLDSIKIEEKKFYNEYGNVNNSSQKKLERIGKDVHLILKKIRNGEELSKVLNSELKYFLKAGPRINQKDLISNLIDIIPFKYSLIQYISNYLGEFLSKVSDSESNSFAAQKFEEIFNILNNLYLSEWVQFWLFKVLSASPLAFDNYGFYLKVQELLKDEKKHFLIKIVALFYTVFDNIDTDDSGFSCDDIKRLLSKSQCPLEKSIYLFFLGYLNNSENKQILIDIANDSLISKSPEIQLMGIYLAKQLKLDCLWENIGEFAKMYFKIPVLKKNVIETTFSNESEQYVLFQGKIPVSQLTPIASILGFNKFSDKETKIVNKVKKNNKIDRILDLIYDGFQIYDQFNVGSSIDLRSGFRKKLFSMCFENVNKPNRYISRNELEMTPSQIKEGLNRIWTHWSTVFSVDRDRIREIIYYDEKTASVVIGSNIKFGKPSLVIT